MSKKKSAKKAAVKKVALKNPAKKAAGKKAATKKSAAKKSTVKKAAKKAAQAISPSPDAIAKAAYLNYRRRVELGLPGDNQSDWVEAERSLRNK
ncbi:hypothetical protein [Luteolibacter sp. AS25]|uniref:hypothetical protein n=1 Tax=Luteolibacter sp. AS25 TaxID=3135776 RepID=UPI00398B88CA